MFRKTLLIAALALTAMGGLNIARAEGEGETSNITQTLRPAAQPGQNTMGGAGVPSLEVIAGMDRPVVVYTGPSTQNDAAPGPLHVVPTDNGSFSTPHR